MECSRCNGYLVRDTGFQYVTHSSVAYHCVNCGNYIDLRILRNRLLTPEELKADANNRVKHSVGDDIDGLFGFSGLFLGSSSLFKLL